MIIAALRNEAIAMLLSGEGLTSRKQRPFSQQSRLSHPVGSPVKHAASLLAAPLGSPRKVKPAGLICDHGLWLGKCGASRRAEPCLRHILMLHLGKFNEHVCCFGAYIVRC